MDDRKARLREAASQNGFAACRVAPAIPPPHAEAYQEWLDRGDHAEMEWMRRSFDRRLHPDLVLPGVRSFVVLAMNYWQGDAPEPPSPDAMGRVARYAWGLDYHDLIEERMRPLSELLASWGGEQKSYVDTGPVLERDYAALAGIGWHGKSTLLLSRELGTWFFLAEILTTLELEPDEPVSAHCGKCTRCMDACPTNAFPAPYRLDANRCISYLTIEHKGPIPLEFREAIGDRIFGCDECLAACPWNRFAKTSSEATFQARHATTGMRLRDYLALSDEEFRSLFRGSPIKRTKRPRFLRNVCVALGNTGDTSDLPALEAAALEPDELIREHALWAMEKIQERCGSQRGSREGQL